MRITVLGCCLLLLACAAEEAPQAGSLGPPSLAEGADNVMPLGTVGLVEGAIYNDVAVMGRAVYGCTGTLGLRVAHVQDDYSLSTVVESGALPGGGGCLSLAVAPDGAVFAAGKAESGAWIGAVNPATGEVSEAFEIADVQLQSIAANESHVFVALGRDGVRILGRNDGALAEVGSLAVGFDQVLGVEPWGERLLVADGLSGIAILDVSDPTAPTIDDRFDTYGTARRIAVQDDLAYVASVGGGVGIYDLTASQPYPPMGKWTTHASSVDVAPTADGRLFVANFDDLSVLDVQDPTAPALVATETMNPALGSKPRVVGVRSLQGAAYVAEWSGLWVLGHAPDRMTADIQLSKPRLDFGIVGTSKKGKGIVVQNLGTSALEVSEIRIGHETFSAELEPSTLEPGGQSLLEILFEPVDSEAVETTITLVTNDPDEAEVQIPVTANSANFLQVGATFDPSGQLVYQEYATGNDVTLKAKYGGKVVILAYFGSS